MTEATPNNTPIGGASPAQKATTARKAPTRKAKTTEAAPAAKASSKVPLKRICQELKIDPRAARRKLRTAELGFHTERDRWEFTEKQAERIRAILSPPAAKKE